MVIDREYVEATRQNLKAQEVEFSQNLERVRGALLLADAMLARLAEQDPESPDQVAEEKE